MVECLAVWRRSEEYTIPVIFHICFKELGWQGTVSGLLGVGGLERVVTFGKRMTERRRWPHGIGRPGGVGCIGKYVKYEG